MHGDVGAEYGKFGTIQCRAKSCISDMEFPISNGQRIVAHRIHQIKDRFAAGMIRDIAAGNRVSGIEKQYITFDLGFHFAEAFGLDKSEMIMKIVCME